MKEPAPLAPSSPDRAEVSSSRSRRQLGLFFAGSAFVVLSSLITRRSIVRRTRSVRPPFFHPSNEQPLVKFNGPLEALDALGVATINVFSYGIMMAGGLFWAFDILNLTELKERVKMNKIEVPEDKAAAKHDDDEMVVSWPAAALALREEHAVQETANTSIAQTIESELTPGWSNREGIWRRGSPTR